MHINPYLNLGGNCAKAFEFYKQQLNGQDLVLMPYRGTPVEQHTPEQWRDKIMHASLQIGPTVLMGSDGMADQPYDGVHGCSITLTLDSDDEAARRFDALAQNGKITMALEETFWASKFGMLVDQFGVAWMVMSAEKP